MLVQQTLVCWKQLLGVISFSHLQCLGSSMRTISSIWGSHQPRNYLTRAVEGGSRLTLSQQPVLVPHQQAAPQAAHRAASVPSVLASCTAQSSGCTNSPYRQRRSSSVTFTHLPASLPVTPRHKHRSTPSPIRQQGCSQQQPDSPPAEPDSPPADAGVSTGSSSSSSSSVPLHTSRRNTAPPRSSRRTCSLPISKSSAPSHPPSTLPRRRSASSFATNIAEEPTHSRVSRAFGQHVVAAAVSAAVSSDWEWHQGNEQQPASSQPERAGGSPLKNRTNSTHVRFNSSSSGPFWRRRTTSSLPTAAAYGTNGESSSHKTSRIPAVQSAAPPGSAVASWDATTKAVLLQPHRTPVVRNGSGIHPARTYQQHWQPQSQQRDGVRHKQEQFQQLQELCRHPQHWQQYHKAHQHHMYDALHNAQQQQQHHWPPHLQEVPSREDTVLLDISTLWRESQAEVQPPQTNWRRASRRTQQQEHAAVDDQSQVQPQPLLWVTVYQPDGPGTAAAVWTAQTGLPLSMEQLRLAGEGKEQQVFVEHCRRDMGQQPAAVVYGHTFKNSRGADLGSNIGGFEAGAENSTASVDAANGKMRSSGWYDYLLLVQGDFSVLEHDNMFPNALRHCGDGRIIHNARYASDVASFVAEAEEHSIREHMHNLIRFAWDKRDPDGNRKGLDPDWVMHRIQQRWGWPAMSKFGVDMAYFNQRFSEAGVVQLKWQSPSVVVA